MRSLLDGTGLRFITDNALGEIESKVKIKNKIREHYVYKFHAPGFQSYIIIS